VKINRLQNKMENIEARKSASAAASAEWEMERSGECVEEGKPRETTGRLQAANSSLSRAAVLSRWTALRNWLRRINETPFILSNESPTPVRTRVHVTV
jgi:hypothetical protein